MFAYGVAVLDEMQSFQERPSYLCSLGECHDPLFPFVA